MSTAPEVATHVTTAEPAHPAVGAATALLDDYTPGRRFLATPTRTLLAEGVHAHVPHDDRPLPQRVAAALAAARAAGTDRPHVIGAVAFDQSAPAALAVPETLRTAPPLTADPLIALPAETPEATDWRIRPVPSPEEYGEGVAGAVERMWRGEFSKVVLARTLELTAPAPLDIPLMLQRLARRDPSGYTFALPTAPGRTLVGASPELLVSRRGHQVVANPLAGSTPRSSDLAEDVRRAAALLESAKDLHEHAVVVDAVHQALAPFCTDLTIPARPTLIRTATMWHLSTTVTGALISPDASALELACALHPTPAVCGTPTATAREVIRETEPFDRGFFTGMVGWGDADGDGEWVVTIRCAEAEERSLRLYAGAGVVAASDPAAETAETGAKFRTFLDAVGAEL
ncbi:isochorismate synthase DhbC [Streptomyces alfalfae]|uniref:isochorismate synthase n=1 Tax=Streptomyces alfalfae TaxID=1642299 RepID=A0ABM6GVR5_9ACTN|nr:isochorismate synthase DhbC [Streptomyces alfalfae]APY87788.1 isochorismate synthase [Streptomyces alfalfae]AYA15239.1 isochorismate synthase DhbC [Streptomyces fradiae]RXX35329.1 isochorismate synthase DhbC [Streptomyces alfalfae]RZM93635.1 isochorismate synthase DhbC [Streptomyces alfalfae]